MVFAASATQMALAVAARQIGLRFGIIGIPPRRTTLKQSSGKGQTDADAAADGSTVGEPFPSLPFSPILRLIYSANFASPTPAPAPARPLLPPLALCSVRDSGG